MTTLASDWLQALLRELYPRRCGIALLTLALRPAATNSVPIKATTEEQLSGEQRYLFLKSPLNLPERYLEPHA